MDIYVGNLPYDADEKAISDSFAAYGNVEKVKVVIDHETGKSKGVAFVTMANADEARNAIENLNGASINGRAIKVNEARPREERPAGAPRPGGFGGGRPGGPRPGGFGGGGRSGPPRQGGFGGGGRSSGPRSGGDFKRRGFQED
jgi:RNA recognition motif-containing protein